MKILRNAVAAAGLAAAMIAAPAQAITITNADGTFEWTGFDWAQGGTAQVVGYAPTVGQNFTLNFFSWAVSLNATGSTFAPPGLDINANGAPNGSSYEYTVVATLNETVTGCLGTTTCTFGLTSGTFEIYYDTQANANSTAGSLGTGFTDGTLLIAGTFGAQAGGSFTSDAGGLNGSGNSALVGEVTYTNTAFIDPSLTGTTVGTLLQLGNLTTNWTNPGGFDGVAFGDGEIILQADANQNFRAAAVPEPNSIALIGIALAAGAAVSGRRRKQQ